MFLYLIKETEKVQEKILLHAHAILLPLILRKKKWLRGKKIHDAKNRNPAENPVRKST